MVFKNRIFLGFNIPPECCHVRNDFYKYLRKCLKFTAQHDVFDVFWLFTVW